MKRRVKPTRLAFIFFLILAWTFISWPRILNFPSGIQEAQAITVVTPSTKASNCNQLTVSSHNISRSDVLILVGVSLEKGDDDDNNYAEIWYLDPSLNPSDGNYDVVTIKGSNDDDSGSNDDDSDSDDSDDDSSDDGAGDYTPFTPPPPPPPQFQGSIIQKPRAIR